MSDFSITQPPSTNASSEDRQSQGVPYVRDAEEAVLGAVLINPEAFYDVAQFLSTEDFFLHRNRWIWEAFEALTEQRLPIDVLTVSEELERNSRLDEAGGASYLAGLIGNVPTSLHAEAYGHLIEETATRRRLLEAANSIARLAYQTEIQIEDVDNDAEKAVFFLKFSIIVLVLGGIHLIL